MATIAPIPASGRDRANLDLSGAQQRLVEAVVATGTPTVVVLVNSKPLSIPWIAEHVPAVVEAWNPGSLGGAAVASILFGDRNPGAKLTISFPHHVGQQPVYYDQIPGWHVNKYVDLPEDPLYAFGFGLSYTTFAYSDLRVLTKTLGQGCSLAGRGHGQEHRIARWDGSRAALRSRSVLRR